MSFEKLPLYKKSDLKYLCEVLIPITSLKSMHYGSNFCPFHHNVNTSASSLFKDKDGIERLYCYSCKRQYTSYDFITEILMENPIQRLLELHTKEELDEILKNKIDYTYNQFQNIEFKNIKKLLEDIYNFSEAKAP